MSIFSPQELSRLPKSRKEAKQLNSKHYFTGNTCIHHHVCHRYTGNGECSECAKIRSTKYFEDNLEIVRERKRKQREENAEHIREMNRIYRENHKEQINKYNSEYKKNNLDKGSANAARRRAKRKNQTPDDANHDLINGFYKQARELNDVYGTKMEVDHIIPIDAGGLHHEDNLQLLPQSLNGSKGAKTDWVHPNNIDEQPLTDEMIEWVKSFD